MVVNELQAAALAANGFDWFCEHVWLAHYKDGIQFFVIQHCDNLGKKPQNWNESATRKKFSAPHGSITLDWFRKVKDIPCSVSLIEKEDCLVYRGDVGHLGKIEKSTGIFYNYEDAESSLINLVLISKFKIDYL